MKLIYCTSCSDVVRLTKRERECECGKAHGQYHEDGLNATIGGTAVPLGFANYSFVDAVRSQPEDGRGHHFVAFVIPRKCPTVAVLP